jgi:hypothetical protein
MFFWKSFEASARVELKNWTIDAWIQLRALDSAVIT